MNKPYISVTMTCYNYAKYMLRGLNAIKNQTFRDFEIVLVDDCSKDNTVEVVNQFIQENPDLRIKFIVNKENKGVLESRNILLDNACGKYIMMCDSDDWMELDCLETLANATENGVVDRVIAEFRDVNEKGETRQIQDLPENPSKWICGVHHGTLYKKEIFDKYNIRFGNYYPDDVYINMQFNRYCKEVRFVHKVIYNWFIHSDSTSAATKKESDWMGVKTFGQILEYGCPIYDELNEEEKKAFELMMIKLYCLNIYHSYRYTKYKTTVKNYYKIHKMFIEKFPKYKKNKYVKLFKDAPMRKYAIKICRLTVLIEKFHLMWLALFGYHLISKVHYFDM